MRKNTLADKINEGNFTADDLISVLGNNESALDEYLFQKASEVRDRHIGKKVFIRALLEVSNQCTKNCYYCGLRAGNHQVKRYTVDFKEIIETIRKAYENGFINFVVQSGEREDHEFIEYITKLCLEIQRITGFKAGITLSCGEQKAEVYKNWFEAGANRYLLRIETSDEALYYQIHPKNKRHSFQARIEALENLRNIGYQTGTGIMIGLPGQNFYHLANDLMFIRMLDVDMVGMGPYLEHQQTPFFERKNELWPLEMRFRLTLKMYSLLRLMMKDINIASTTAMETISDGGRLAGIQSGCNVLMFNLTPLRYTSDYRIYDNKPVFDDPFKTAASFIHQITQSGFECLTDVRGDSLHFLQK